MTWQSHTVETNGITLNYIRTGGDKPVLILAHGVTDSGLCWTPVAKALEADYDIIMVDARGHGLSDGPESGYSSDFHAADIYGLINALGLNKPAILGHSMGAATSLALAGLYPDAIGAMLLEDPPAWWLPAPPNSNESEAQKRIAGMREWVASLKQKSREQLIEEERARTNWSDDELEPWADAKLQFSEHVLRIFGPSNAAAVDWAGIIKNIKVPSLLIYADPDKGGIIGPESAQSLVEIVPTLETAYIANAGHSIRRDQLDAYLQVVSAFLSEHAR
jgi:N-formylmaleamate deformylase